MINLITNKEFVVKNKHGRTRTSDVKELIMCKYKSVTHVEFCDTTSSAGDWSGIIIQELRGKCYAVPFSMENRMFADDGFSIYVGSCFIEIDSNMKYNTEYLYDVWNSCFIY